MILKQIYLVPSLHFFMRQAQFKDVLLSEHLCGSAQQLQTFWRRRRRVLITCPKTHTQERDNLNDSFNKVLKTSIQNEKY